MKIKKYCLLLTLFVLTITHSIAQIKVITPLKIGETLRDIEISNVINYPSKKFKFSDLRGKLLILDFWGVHCSSCIREMPKIMALQKEFGSRIQFILVTSDSRSEVNRLHQSSPVFRNIDLPIIFSDTILSRMFPYSAYGLHVWIDTIGRVRLKTDGDSYTENDIRNFLDGKKVALIERADTINFNRNAPLWLEGNGRQLKYFEYYSFITKNIPGYASCAGNLIIDSISGKIIGLHFINMPIVDLFIEAYSEWGRIKWDKLTLQVSDSSKYLKPSDLFRQYEWFRENTFSYELKLPPSKSKEVFSIMRQDLQRYFGLSGKIEKLQQNCWLLRIKKNQQKIICDSNEQSNDKKDLQFDNIKPTEFAKRLSSFMGIPVFDETNSKGTIHLSIPVSKSFSDLNIALGKYGFELVKTSRLIAVFELKELTDSLTTM